MTDPSRDEPVLITPDMLAPGSSGARVDFERGMAHAPALTLLLIVANTAVFAWQVASGALQSEASILAAGALSHERVFAGEVWRLATAPFLHGGVDHLIGNAIVLYIVGLGCEHAFGPGRTALIYAFAALCGSYASALVNPGPSVGASGAIFGVTAALIVVLYRYRDRFYVRDKRVGFVLLVWAGYQVVTGLVTPYIDNAAHVGGFLGGAAIALTQRPRLLPARPEG